MNIFYCFGGIVLTSFLLQVIFGFILTFYYRPTVLEAYNSVIYLLYNINLGWLVRSLHRWSSSLMVLGLVFYIGRVYITGGFLKFREFIWLTGLILVFCTVSFGVTGYSLPWDQLGFWASKIVTSVPEVLDELIDSLGLSLVILLRGGFSVF